MKTLVPAERMLSLDVLRGVAVLGILVMNIPSFAFAGEAFFTPTLQGWHTEADAWAWRLGHIVFDMKMMAIFSMLFGAGLVVYAERRRAEDASPTTATARRLGWLLAIGIIHAYLIWEGDILVMYAITGMVVYLLRNLRPAWQIVIAAGLLAVGMMLWSLLGLYFESMRDAAAMDIARGLDSSSSENIQAWQEMRPSLEPGPEEIEKAAPGFTGSFSANLERRVGSALIMHFFLFPTWGFWRIAGLMLMGMALLKWGVLSGERSRRLYAGLAAVGYGFGLPIVLVGFDRVETGGFDLIRFFKIDHIFNYVGSLAVAIGHIGLILLVCQTWPRGFGTRVLAAVGRMALTNYLAQSVMCSILFYGWGFGLWGKLTHAELWLVTLPIWGLQLAWSPFWLARFHYGPAEWAWRSLTRWRFQPMA